MRSVAALFVDRLGPYPKIAGVDCWDEKRDARGFRGGVPVVAHPPCGPWGMLRHLSKHPEHRELAATAVGWVRECGGVLEHPAHSTLFRALALPFPGDRHDACGGYTIEIQQCEWGHVARKRTWLYIVGVESFPDPPFPGRQPTHWVSGGRNLVGHTSAPEGIKICSAQQRRRTPTLLAQALVDLARTVKP